MSAGTPGPAAMAGRRDRLAGWLGRRGVFVAVAVATLALTVFGPVSYLVGLAGALLTLWATRWDWRRFGLARPRWGADLARGLRYTLAIVVAVDIVAQPLVNRALGAPADLSAFESLRGNLPQLLAMLAFMWVVAALGEELFYRGYLMRGWARSLGDGRRGWVAGALLSTLPFGLVHLYQGMAGVFNTGLVGLVLAVQFYRGRERLFSCMLTHGIYDTVGLTLIYLGRESLLESLLPGS